MDAPRSRKSPYGAFALGANLEILTLSSTITSIKNNAFNECVKLNNGGVPSDKVNFNGVKCASVTTLSGGAFPFTCDFQYVYTASSTCASLGSASTVLIDSSIGTIPGKLTGASCNTQITRLDVSQATTLTAIGSHAFGYTGLSSVDLSGAVQLATIGVQAFENSPSLATFKFATSVTTIGANAFQGTALTSAATVDFNQADCVAIFAASSSPPFSFRCPRVPLLAATQTTSAVTGVETTIEFDFSDYPLSLYSTSNSRSYLKLVSPGADCETGNRLSGNDDDGDQITRVSNTKGTAQITVANAVTNAVMCYRIGANSGVVGLFRRLGASTFSVSVSTASSMYVYNNHATCTYDDNSDIQCCGTATSIEIAAERTDIKISAFKFCTTVTSVIFQVPASLTVIGASAFYQMTALTEIDMSPATALATVGQGAFMYSTVLQSAKLSPGTTSLGNEFLEGTAITTSTPGSVDFNGVVCTDVASDPAAGGTFPFACAAAQYTYTKDDGLQVSRRY